MILRVERRRVLVEMDSLVELPLTEFGYEDDRVVDVRIFPFPFNPSSLEVIVVSRVLEDGERSVREQLEGMFRLDLLEDVEEDLG